MPRHGAHRQERSSHPLLLPVVLALGLVGGGLLAWQALGPEPQKPAEASCKVERVDVTVAPRVRDLVEQGLDTLRTECLDFVVAERTAGDVALAVAFGGGSLPSLWIGDGAWMMESLQDGGVGLDVVSPALASTPVVVVGGTGADRSASWGELLSARQVALPDPLQDAVGTLALASTHLEGRELGRTLEEATSLMVPTAQRYGEMASKGGVPNLSLSDLRGDRSRLVVTTEQDLARVPARAWTDVTPETGALALDFPLAVPGDASLAVRSVADALSAWFESTAGRAALEESDLRGGDHSPLASGRGVGEVTTLPTPGRKMVEADLATWKRLTVPSSILAVFDVSGSMDFEAPSGGTRIDLAVGVARTALGILPDHARVGLWAFSVNQDGPRDYRVMEQLKRLDARVGGTTQRQRLLAHADTLPAITRGGTGLNDTAVAAYRRAVRDFNPNYGNAVILLTDGSNEDPGSISEERLLKELKAARDPDRPVRIVAIGLTRDADMDALRAIARATGGTAYQANTPEDVLQVFAQEIANR